VRGGRKRFRIGVDWSAIRFTGLSQSKDKNGELLLFLLSLVDSGIENLNFVGILTDEVPL
jgi:hypothetical protein